MALAANLLLGMNFARDHEVNSAFTEGYDAVMPLVAILKMVAYRVTP